VRLSGLELVNFRSWGSLQVEFPEGAVALVGPNATGKTSILEAAWYAASLSSHRTSSDAVMVAKGASSAIIRASVERDERTEIVELEIVTHGRARTRLGGAPVGRRREILGLLRAALFAPERVAVVRGDPGERRRFADELLVQLHPRYHAVIRDYDRALRQRNALLREAGGRPPAGLEAWDSAIAAAGGEICAGRHAAIEGLSPAAGAAFDTVGGDAGLSVWYAANVPEPMPGATPEAWSEAIRRRLEERRSDELVRGVTLAGPHRDDLEVTIGGLPSRTHASQGEAWLATLALVLGARASTAAHVGVEPVLLLDDAFSLLDPERRERLVSALPPRCQIIATASDPRECPTSLRWSMFGVSLQGVNRDA
jgi:DNA replication and repair protein RecF